MSDLIKYQVNKSIVKRADNYLLHLDTLLQKRYAPDLPELIPYRRGEYWGFCNKDKEIVIDCNYRNVERFSDGKAQVIGACWERLCLDINGNEISIFKNNDKYQNYNSIGSYSEGLAIVEVEKWARDYVTGRHRDISHYGYIDKEGIEVISCRYREAYPFTEGLGCVYIQEDSLYITENELSEFKNKDRWAFINHQGFPLIECFYREAFPFYESLALVETCNKWGFINKNGNLVIGLIYDSATSFCEGLAAVRLNKKWGFINHAGNVIIDFLYDAVDFFKDGLCSVKKHGKWGFINSEGKIVIDTIYESVSQNIHSIFRCNSHCLSFEEDLAAVGLNGKFGYIDKFGNQKIEIIYDSITSFSNGLACVKIDRTAFYIDKLGEIFLQAPNFDSMPFKDGLAFSSCFLGQSEFGGYIDKSGNQYWENPPGYTM